MAASSNSSAFFCPSLAREVRLLGARRGISRDGPPLGAAQVSVDRAGDSARFGQPAINLGIIPGAGGTQRWPRTVGKYVAMEVNLGGAPIPARRAHQLGLVNRVVPAEVTIRVAIGTARTLAAKAPLAVRLAKDAVNQALETPLAQGVA